MLRSKIADELTRGGQSRIPLMVYQRMVRRLFDRSGITPGDATWSCKPGQRHWAGQPRRDSSRSIGKRLLRDIDQGPLNDPRGTRECSPAIEKR